MKKLMGLLCIGLMLGSIATAQTIVPGSIVNGTGSTLSGATDVDYSTYFEISATGGPGNRVSFVVDLGSIQPVNSIGLYGSYLYNSAIQMLSNQIDVEAGVSDTGPWVVCGSINVGNTRPTDPDPAIGGVNPFTGGNGRLIPFTTKFNTRYLRITGDQGFDNIIRIYHLQINPKLVIHRMIPINQGVAYQPFDFGGGANNSRLAVDMVDGRINTRTFIGTTATLILDTGAATPVGEFRILTSDNDAGNVPEAGRVLVSSTDSPTNLDTLLTSFDDTPQFNSQGVTQIVLPLGTNKRYYGLVLNSNRDEQTGTGVGPTLRIGEIEYRVASQIPLRNVSTVGVEGGTGSNLSNASDTDYLSIASLDQTASSPEGAFIFDLGTAQDVSSVAAYGWWEYQAPQNLFGGDVFVDSGTSASGPWTQIGTVNVGINRPTNEDPTIGGVNPWTGGNGRRIPCTTTNTRFLRVRGSWAYDNSFRLMATFVNPPVVVHTVTPVNNSTDNLFNRGGGTLNSRIAADTADGDLRTRFLPNLSSFSLTYDVSNTAQPLNGIRLYAYESDISLLPSSGEVRVSSTDDPTNMDTVVGNFGAYNGGGVVQVNFATVTKKYVRVVINQASRRFAEVEVLRPVPDNTVVPVELSFFEMQ